MDLYELAVAKALSGSGGGGGGGSSNLVTGEFVPTENGVMPIDIPYTGTGYPLSLLIYVRDGYANPTNTDFYDLLSQNATCVHVLTKTKPSDAPDYSANAEKNRMDGLNVRKNNASNAHSYNAQASQGTRIFADINPSNSWNLTVMIPSATQMKVLVGDAGTYGFRVGVHYFYAVLYSS